MVSYDFCIEWRVWFGPHIYVVSLTRSVGIFDVSHMLQTRIDGTDRKSFMESLVVTDIEGKIGLLKFWLHLQ